MKEKGFNLVDKKESADYIVKSSFNYLPYNIITGGNINVSIKLSHKNEDILMESFGQDFNFLMINLPFLSKELLVKNVTTRAAFDLINDLNNKTQTTP
ncbi:MAG: hypothetical protein WCL30_00980 [Pseudomonadota bacterium]